MMGDGLGSDKGELAMLEDRQGMSEHDLYGIAMMGDGLGSDKGELAMLEDRQGTSANVVSASTWLNELHFRLHDF